MLGAEAEGLSSPADCSRLALDFIHALLVQPAAEPKFLDALVKELAGAFGAQGAGVALLPDAVVFACHRSPGGSAEAWPWQGNPDLPAQVRQSPTARMVPRPEGGTLLLTVFGPAGADGWLLWVEDSRRQAWTGGEAAALTLAGHALERWLDSGEAAPRWARQLDRAARQQRLELAAQVTRRLTHDFGNALTGILGFSELALAQQPRPDSALHTYISEVHKGAQGGAQLTQILRLFARRQAVPTRCASLASVLAEEEVRLRKAASPPVRFQVSLPTDLPPLQLDSEQLRQVLASLLDNAREAAASMTESSPEIRITARARTLDQTACQDLYGDARPGPCVEVLVADNGPGLSLDAQRRLFGEPFFSTKSRRRGFGLASAYGILYAHRGGLDVRSAQAANGAGRGVEARFVVPVAGSTVPRSADTPAASSVPGERVLVVDDDPMLLHFVSRILEQAGYRAHNAATGEEALQAYTQAGNDPFRLVLTDVLMPGISGVDLAHRLLQRDAGVRVLFMTGQVSLDYLQQTFQGASFEVLSKPFRPELLLRAVRTALDHEAPVPSRSAGPTECVSNPASPARLPGGPNPCPVDP